MDELISLPPFLPLFIGGCMLVFMPAAGQRVILLVAPLLSLMSLFTLGPESIFPVNIVGTSVQLLALQEYSLVFGFAFCLASLATACFGLRHAKPKEMAAFLILASGGLGVIFAGDVLSLLFFWEVLMGASVYLIYLGTLKIGEAVAWRYFLVHALGSTFLLAGIAGTIMDSGTTAFPSFQMEWIWPRSSTEWAGWLMMLGVMVNLGALPFSAWLPDSYPAASPFGTIALSIFTTKSALFVLIQLFAGSTPLLAVGFSMLFYGMLMALLHNHLRRYICYCIIAQVGVMVMAVGLGNESALMGASILAFAHIGYNGLLTTTAGALILQTQKHRMTELGGGLWKHMPITAGAIVLGGLSMAAMPITGAFIGKHLIYDALSSIEQPVLLLLFLAGTAIAVYMLYPWFALSGKTPSLKVKEVGYDIQFGYGLFAFLALAPGLYPDLLSLLIPHRPEIVGYKLLSVIGQFLLIGFSICAFVMLLPRIHYPKGLILDIDWVYRVFIPHCLKLINQFYIALERKAHAAFHTCFQITKTRAIQLCSESGVLTRPQTIGLSAALITAVLLLFLLFFYQ